MISAIGSVYGSSIDYTSLSTTQTSVSNSSDLFNKISTSSGGDGNSLTKEQVEDYALKTKNDDNSSEDQSDFLNKLTENWENKTNGLDSMSKSEFEKSYDSYQAQKQSSDKSDTETGLLSGNDETSDSSVSGSSALTVFLQSHASSIGSSGDKITKAELVSYLNSLMSDQSGKTNSNDIAAIKKILSKFDVASSDGTSTTIPTPDKYTTQTVGGVISTVEYSV